MNDKAALIRAFSAIPGLDPLPPSAPLTCEIAAASLVCLLGQQFSVINAYMQMLAGTHKPYMGTIDYADSLLTNRDNSDCRAIAYLYHNSALLSFLNGIDNVKVPALYHQLASTAQIDKEVHALVGELEYGADHLILPAFMSMLQKRHLLIVRAIMLKPTVLFIENPFSSLDRDQVRVFGHYLSGLVKNKNITLITSNANLDFVRSYADQMIYITAANVHVFNHWESFSDYIKDKSAKTFDEMP
jgi:ABC-type multidrug transport system ATPase subunit